MKTTLKANHGFSERRTRKTFSLGKRKQDIGGMNPSRFLKRDVATEARGKIYFQSFSQYMASHVI